MHDGWMPWGHGGGFGGMWFGPITWIVVLALLIWLAMTLMRRNGGSDTPSHGQNKTPREILDERFARGEIDDEEYRRRRGILGS